MTPGGTEHAVADGRVARSRRTRAVVVGALVDLLTAGRRPTAAQVARDAGVSVRTVWTHFADFEELFAATADEVLSRQDARFRPVDPMLPLQERIAGFCRQRARLLEAVGPFARASQWQEAFSPTLRHYHRLHVERVVDECRVLFAAELRPLAAGEETRLLAALAAAGTWGAWAVLRDDLAMSPRVASEVLRRSVTALLADATRPENPPGAP